MTKIVRAGVACFAAVALMTTVGYGTAMAEDNGGGDSIEGDGTSFGSFEFQASNDSADPFDAEGFFRGVSPFGPGFTLDGPIVCLQVEGNRAGFIYQTEDEAFPLFSNQDVLVSVEDNGPDGDKIGFSFGKPAGTLDSCAPGDTPDDVKDGDITVN